MRHARGLSLAEALVTSFALLLALSLVASLATEYNRAMAFSGEKDKVMVASRTLIESLRADFEAAFSVDLSTPDNPKLQRVRGDADPTRLTNGLPGGWTAWAPQWVQSVDYRVQDECAIRRVSEEYVVASGIRGLSVTSSEPGLIKVDLTFMEANQRARTLHTLILRHVAVDP